MDTIKSSDQISEVFNRGTRFSSGEIRIIVKQTTDQRDPRGRVAFIAGKKLGNAVVRNCSKRILRAVAHENRLPVPGYDVLLMATPRTRTASHEKVVASLAYLLRKAGLR